MAKTRAQTNRGIRQDALREQLSAQGHVQHIVDNIKNIEELDIDGEHFNNSLNKLKVANEQRLKLVNKYLPELKATELTGGDGEELNTVTTVNFIPVGNEAWNK